MNNNTHPWYYWALTCGLTECSVCYIRRVYVSVPAPSQVNFGTVDPQTGTWAYTDKSLGAGVEVGPSGASILSRNPTQVSPL